MKPFNLRPWRATDVDNLARFANNENIAKYLTDKFPFPYTKADAESFIASANRSQYDIIYAIEIQNTAVGSIGLHLQQDIYRKNAEIGYWLAEPFWGQGIITKVILEMLSIGFKRFDIERIFARPFEYNRASQKCLVKAGFTMEAKLPRTVYKNGEYLGELIYGIRREDFKGLM
ncbi:N-acetyltransferase [Maribacter algicola]|uniref:N-acetyltransferase n=1 Tax=Maribacter algicola TaxID=2498892 RepID=A0A3R8PXU9_9FLAO|nr:GNAT family protein [Maribacter algicola]RRQ48297.1 N-acetyltransferase [Maribacter algicola]